MKKLLALLALSPLAFAQNASNAASSYISPYYPLINSPYIAGAIALVRDITIIVVLWLLYEKFKDSKVDKEKPEKKEK
jgi:hypothetical protein